MGEAREPGQPAPATRRRLLGGGVLSLLAAALVGRAPRAGADPRDKKGKLRLCRRQASDCRNEATAYCAANYPDQNDACLSDILKCCKRLKSCNYKGANRCNSRVIW
ncbi:MAG: hypothetical protein QM692_10660 [Thermomicrobiales bacterium]